MKGDFHNYKKRTVGESVRCIKRPRQMGIRAIALGTQELVDLYYNWYNPDVAVNEKLIDASQLETRRLLAGRVHGRQQHITRSTIVMAFLGLGKNNQTAQPDAITELKSFRNSAKPNQIYRQAWFTPCVTSSPRRP